MKISPVLKLLLIMSAGLFFGFGADYILQQFDLSISIRFLNYNLNLISVIFNVILLPLIIAFYTKKLYFIQYTFLCFLIGANVYFINFNSLNTTPKEFLFEQREVYLSGQIERIISQKKNISDSTLTNYTLLVNSKIQSTFLPTHKSNVILKLSNAKNVNFQIGDKFTAKAKLSFPKIPQFYGEFNERKFCDNYNAHWVAKSLFSDFSITEKSIPNIKNNFNNHIVANINRLYQGQSNAFVNAFILGDQTKLDTQTKEIFSKNGTAHLFSVSGFHIGIFTFLIMVFTTFIINDKFKFLIISIILLIYTYLIGMPEAMIRSVAFILLYFYIKLQFLKVNALNLLSFFVVILLVFFPSFLFNLGMQLSLAAFSGMIIFNPLLTQKIEYLKQKVKAQHKVIYAILSSLFVTLSASIFISPLIAYYFNFYSFSSFISNLLSVVFLSFAVFYSFISVIVIEFNFEIANLFAYLTSFLIDVSLYINELIYTFDFLIIKNRNIFYISILISICSIYLITAKNLYNFYFKFFISVTIVGGYLYFSQTISTTEQNIYHRPQNVVFIKSYKSKNNAYNLVLIEQRKFYSYYLRDLELIKNLNNLKGKTIVLYNGDLGNEIKKDSDNSANLINKNIKFYRVNLNELTIINNRLKLNSSLYNTIYSSFITKI